MNVRRIFPLVLMCCALGAWQVSAAEQQTEQKAPGTQKSGVDKALEHWFDGEMPSFAFPDFQDDEFSFPGMLAFADDRKDHKHSRQRHAEKIQLFRLWKLMEDLNLSDEQVDKFFPLMREYGKQERELARQRSKLIKELYKALDSEETPDSRLEELLDQLKKNNREVVESKNETIEEAAKIIDVRQQVRLALSLHRLERDIWESIARVRHMAPGEYGPMGFDKEKLEEHMKKLKENLFRISKELEAKGYPGLDLDIDVEIKEDGKEK